MNKDFADMVITEKRLLFIPALVAFEAPLIPTVRTEPLISIPRSDILDARFTRRWQPLRYLWGDRLVLRTRQGKLLFSVDREDTAKAREAVRVLRGRI